VSGHSRPTSKNSGVFRICKGGGRDSEAAGPKHSPTPNMAMLGEGVINRQSQRGGGGRTTTPPPKYATELKICVEGLGDSSIQNQ
jgi:hypothetical protein